MSNVPIPQKVTVIVFNAKGLKPKNKGKHKFSVIFGIGANKFRTDVVEDLFDNPVFNTESEIEVGDPNLPLTLTVTEKQEKDVLGQVTIALGDLSHSRTNRPLKVPLRPHKKCPNPEGEVLMEAWISATGLGPPPTINVTGTEGESSKNAVTAGLKKIKDRMSHSPLLSRKHSEDKDHRRSHSESLFNLTPKGSVSCQDLTSSATSSPRRTSHPENKHLKVVAADSLTSLDSISESSESRRPEVTGVSPNEGPVEGGTKVTIRGSNLGLSKQDVVGLFICGGNVLGSMEFVSSSRLTCVTKPWKACVGNVTVETQSGGKGSSLVQFSFMGRSGEQTSDSASEVSSLSRSSSRGDADLRRTESNKSESSAKGKASLAAAAGASNESASLAKGPKAKSMFDLSLGGLMTAKNPKPEVTGISPMEAPANEVTKVTVRGLNLGQSKSDVARLVICGVDCVANVEYESPTKIFCSLGPAKPGSGSVLLETHSGGKGSSLVTFRFVESTEEESSSWAAVPYSASDEPATMTGSKSADRLTLPDRREPSPIGGRFDKSPGQSNGHSPARLPPPVVEIQPIRMEKKPMASPFRAFGKGKKDKDKAASDAQENRNESPVYFDSNEHQNNDATNRKISELEQELTLSDEQVKKLQTENKLLRDENERMRRYMENLVNRAIATCPQILCVDDKI